MNQINKPLTSLNPEKLLAYSQYRIPKEYIDCRKLLQKRLHGPTGCPYKNLTTKQKAKFKRPFFLDQTVKSTKNIPAPNNYLENYSSLKRYNSLSKVKSKLKESDINLGKRATWIQDIERYEKKYKPPSVGNYDLLKKSDFKFKESNQTIQKKQSLRQKFNNFDDLIFKSTQIPRPWFTQFNGKKPSKLKPSILDAKYWKQNQQKAAKRSKKKLDQSSLSSCSYSPTKDKTFDAISKQPKKTFSSMLKSSIDIRQGIKSLMLSPGPGSHNVLNKWGKQTFHNQKLLGNINIFSKTTSSLPALRIYN